MMAFPSGNGMAMKKGAVACKHAYTTIYNLLSDTRCKSKSRLILLIVAKSIPEVSMDSITSIIFWMCLIVDGY